MAVTKLSNSGIKTGVLKYDSMLAGNAPYDPAATWLIARTSPTSGTSVTFSSIPSTYQHLQIRWIMRDSFANTGAATPNIQFNSDTGTNYAQHYLYGNGTSVSAQAFASNSSIDISGGGYFGSATASCFGVAIVDIHDYASTTKNKTVRYFSGAEQNSGSTNQRTVIGSGLWMSTSAVNSITITTNGSGFVSGSTFALYGFKG